MKDEILGQKFNIDIDVDFQEQEDFFSDTPLPKASDIKLGNIVTMDKHITKFLSRKDSIKEELPNKIKDDESLHLISNGSFGSNELLMAINEKYHITNLICCTWSINNDFIDVIRDLDAHCTLIIDKSIIARKAHFYARFLSYCKNSKTVLIAGMHAKLTLIETEYSGNIVYEASANYSSNVRIEQFTLTNSKNLYKFHHEWIESLINGKHESSKMY
jgi:hypothetical protein